MRFEQGVERRLFSLLRKIKNPGFKCSNCWKFEIWIDNLTDLTESLAYLLEEADKDQPCMEK